MADAPLPGAPGAPRFDADPTGVEPKTGLLPTLRRTFKEFSEDNMTDWAAALTYYGVLSIFPALIAMVSIVGLFGDARGVTNSVTDIVNRLGPKSAADTFAGPIRSITAHRSTAGVLCVVGVLTALWSASGYIGAFSRASNVVWETPEGRPFVKLRPLQLGVTLLMILLTTLVLLGLVLTGPVVDAVAKPLGVSSTAETVWNIAKWPVMLVVVVGMFAVLFHTSPNVRLPSFQWISAGAVFAVTAWILISVLFALYVANFGAYDKTYGTLAGVVALLVWIWLTNCALLLGMELNAERERNRQIEGGVPGAEREIQLAPRSAPDPPQTA